MIVAPYIKIFKCIMYKQQVSNYRFRFISCRHRFCTIQRNGNDEHKILVCREKTLLFNCLISPKQLLLAKVILLWIARLTTLMLHFSYYRAGHSNLCSLIGIFKTGSLSSETLVIFLFSFIENKNSICSHFKFYFECIINKKTLIYVLLSYFFITTTTKSTCEDEN